MFHPRLKSSMGSRLHYIGDFIHAIRFHSRDQILLFYRTEIPFLNLVCKVITVFYDDGKTNEKLLLSYTRHAIRMSKQRKKKMPIR